MITIVSIDRRAAQRIGVAEDHPVAIIRCRLRALVRIDHRRRATLHVVGILKRVAHRVCLALQPSIRVVRGGRRSHTPWVIHPQEVVIRVVVIGDRRLHPRQVHLHQVTRRVVFVLVLVPHRVGHHRDAILPVPRELYRHPSHAADDTIGRERQHVVVQVLDRPQLAIRPHIELAPVRVGVHVATDALLVRSARETEPLPFGGNHYPTRLGPQAAIHPRLRHVARHREKQHRLWMKIVRHPSPVRHRHRHVVTRVHLQLRVPYRQRPTVPKLAHLIPLKTIIRPPYHDGKPRHRHRQIGHREAHPPRLVLSLHRHHRPARHQLPAIVHAAHADRVRPVRQHRRIQRRHTAPALRLQGRGQHLVAVPGLP